MTQLHAGGKFDHDSYKVSGGLHSVGVSVVNALSEKLDLTIFRDDKEYFVSFSNGKTKSPIKFIKKTKKSGTKINFLPSKDIFSSIKFSAATLQKNEGIGLFKQGLSINLIDETHAKQKLTKINMMEESVNLLRFWIKKNLF